MATQLDTLIARFTYHAITTDIIAAVIRVDHTIAPGHVPTIVCESDGVTIVDTFVDSSPACIAAAQKSADDCNAEWASECARLLTPTREQFADMCRSSGKYGTLYFSHCVAVRHLDGRFSLYVESAHGIRVVETDIAEADVTDRAEDYDHEHCMRTARVRVRPLEQCTRPLDYDCREHGIHPDR